MILVELVILKLVAAVVPNLTEVAAPRLLPRITTVVPPEIGPWAGVKEVMVGIVPTKEKLVDEVPVPETLVTEILTVPAACGLVLAKILVDPVTWKVVAAVVPNLTAVAPVQVVPEIVTVAPP